MLKLALAVVLLAICAVAQGPDRVQLKSGRILLGLLASDDPLAVVIDDRELGTVRVPRIAVRSVSVGGRCTELFPLDPPSDPGEVPASHLRWVAPRNGEDGGLETCTSRWLDPATETTVFLVGVVHIAEPEYFGGLQKMLDSCDLVLFEGVGKGEISDNDLGSLDVMMRMQLALRGALGLGFQKDLVDYDREFWVNSDVDFAELRRALTERSASLPTDHPVIQRILKLALSMADGSAARRSPRLQHRMKNLMGPALAQADSILQQPAFAGMRGAVIEYRNTAVMKDLERELGRGIKGRWVAVFYGAGHLPDFARRFESRGMTFQGAAWSRAWKIAAKEPVERFTKRSFDPIVDEERARLGADSGLAVHLETARSHEVYGNRDDEPVTGADQLALMVELFAINQGRLDRPFDGWHEVDEFLLRPEIPAAGWPIRRFGAALFADDPVVRTQARAGVESLLGGTTDARAKLRNRVGIVGGNIDDLAAIARLLAAIARGDVRGVDRATCAALAGVLFREISIAGRMHGATLRAENGDTLDFGYLEQADGECLVWCLAVHGHDLDLSATRQRLITAASDALR